jgi:hypothetical protein
MGERRLAHYAAADHAPRYRDFLVPVFSEVGDYIGGVRRLFKFRPLERVAARRFQFGEFLAPYADYFVVFLRRLLRRRLPIFHFYFRGETFCGFLRENLFAKRFSRALSKKLYAMG